MNEYETIFNNTRNCSFLVLDKIAQSIAFQVTGSNWRLHIPGEASQNSLKFNSTGIDIRQM